VTAAAAQQQQPGVKQCDWQHSGQAALLDASITEQHAQILTNICMCAVPKPSHAWQCQLHQLQACSMTTIEPFLRTLCACFPPALLSGLPAYFQVQHMYAGESLLL
jgi:hypothetical protein